MLTLSSKVLMLATSIGEWEIVLILTVVLILFGAGRISDLIRGLRDGFSLFRKALDRQAHDAGKSVGGIYGKPAAQALTPDNQTAELYDPAVFKNKSDNRRGRRKTWLRKWGAFWRSIWTFVIQRFRGKR